MIVSERGLALIRTFEGGVPYLYDDPANNATVGIGILVHVGPAHTPRGICAECDKWPRLAEKDQWLSEQRMYELLREKVKPYADAVERSTRPLTQNEFDALTSLCFNIGPGGYINSAVRSAVNRNENPCPYLRQIVKGIDGVTYPGLVRRREAECQLFHAGEEHMPTAEYDELKLTTDAIKHTLAETAIDHNNRLVALGLLLEAIVPPLVTGTPAEAQAKYIWAAAGKPWPGGK